MEDATFIIADMIVRGHMAAYVAPGNAGKTTIFVHLSEKIVKAGYELFYVNVDASPGDLKRHYSHSRTHGYKLIAPDAIKGKSPRDVLRVFEGLLESGARLSKVVLILDTLKKFVDVIEKRAALGGVCLNEGCIPSKALLDSSEHFALARDKFSLHGIEIDPPRLNLPVMLARKDDVVKKLTDGVAYLLKKNKVKVITGVASLKGMDEAGLQQVALEQVVIDLLFLENLLVVELLRNLP
jgi:hypothetical protein